MPCLRQRLLVSYGKKICALERRECHICALYRFPQRFVSEGGEGGERSNLGDFAILDGLVFFTCQSVFVRSSLLASSLDLVRAKDTLVVGVMGGNCDPVFF